MSSENYSNRCRTCLSHCLDHRTVFSTDSEENITYSDMIMSLTTVLVLEGDGFSEKMCVFCITELQRAFRFKKLCENSDSTLRGNQTENVSSIKLNIKEETENNTEESANTEFHEIKQESSIEEHHLELKFPDNENPEHESERKPIICNICNKTFVYISCLKKHKLTHAEDAPHVCNICGKGFKLITYLKIHSSVHTGKKPYKCKLCEKSFGAPSSLSFHKKSHMEVRRSAQYLHKCQYCDESFVWKGDLVKHIRSHTGEKPFTCTVCGQGFAYSSSVCNHMKRKHKMLGRD